MKGTLLVCGTHSDAGKSVVVAGICRWLAREGIRVAPFKAQNMALNSYVTRDGAEIGRAQAMQAMAAGIEPEARMNPVLLKPSGAGRTQVILNGRAYATANARTYGPMKRELMPHVLDALEDLRRRYDVVICEGAGSPAEINLRENDLANMGLARAANLPVLLVGDVDRGGLFASLLGTLALLSPEDQRHIGGLLVNKFRGDAAILAPGLAELARRTGRPFFGTLPFASDLSIDAEDSLALDAPRPVRPPLARDIIRVAVARLGRISNFTDYDALAHEPGVAVRFTRSPDEILTSDLAIIPGTKATVDDLQSLRTDGLTRAFEERARHGLPTLGVCGGYQMLGHRIIDGVESEVREVSGLGLLPVETVFEPEKTLGRPSGRALGLGGVEVSGYEIHHGRVIRHGGEPLIQTHQDPEGCRMENTVGTSWHGILEHDSFRRSLLRWVATERDLDWTPGNTPFAEAREAQLDTLADLITEHANVEALRNLIVDGLPHDLPVVSISASQPVSQSTTRLAVGQPREPSYAVAMHEERSPSKHIIDRLHRENGAVNTEPDADGLTS